MRILKKLASNASLMRIGLNLYPPYLGTGIVVEQITSDFRFVTVRMGLHWYNRNYFGSHFGGNLSTMADPFFMLMLIQVLGKEYYVWDHATHIEFLKPALGTVSVTFQLTDSQIAEIKQAAAEGEKHFAELPVEITDEDDQAVARVTKTIYVRRKPRFRANADDA